MRKKYCKVIAEYISAFPEPLLIKKGENLRVENKKSESHGWVWCISNDGKKGWIPKSYLKLKEKQYIVIQDYDATELTVSIGQEFVIEKEESGWIWVSNKNNNQGWIPLKNVKIIKK